MRGNRKVLAAVLFVAASLVAAAAVAEWISRTSPEAQARAAAEALRDEVRASRSEVYACLDELERLETAFRAQEQETEALRRRVRELETLDERGVPSERYEEYLALFDRYNETVPEWERRADSLEAATGRCREITEAYNLRADSLRRLIDEAGLLEEPH